MKKQKIGKFYRKKKNHSFRAGADYTFINEYISNQVAQAFDGDFQEVQMPQKGTRVYKQDKNMKMFDATVYPKGRARQSMPVHQSGLNSLELGKQVTSFRNPYSFSKKNRGKTNSRRKRKSLNKIQIDF